MASARPNVLPNFILTPQQQNLLFRALTSNHPANSDGNDSNSNDKSPANNVLTLSPESLTASPEQNQKSSNTNSANGVQESPYLDFDYDLGPDSSFDFGFTADGFPRMIGDLPGTSSSSKDDSKASSPDNENSDKRSHPDDDDEEDEEEGGGKRRESEGKVPKKPGRKPLMNEPSSKRKAQNRAAQRAFRERKERHLKDLETKVEELEKASTAANNENSQLRAQVDKITMELDQYKKKLAVLSTSRPTPSNTARQNHVFGSSAIGNINDVNFQFEFPKFGILPTTHDSATIGAKQTSSQSPLSGSSRSPVSQKSPSEKVNDGVTASSAQSRDNSVILPKDRPGATLSGLFNSSPYDNTYGASGSRTSLDSGHFSLGGANTGSPSSSTNSNMGPSSSCGTSPEPFTQSPHGSKPLDMLTTIGEEQPALTNDSTAGFGDLGNIDFSNLDWLSQQNGGQFDPQLFGDYREPQNNILANAAFDEGFFNDAFDVDFMAPYNMAVPSPKPPKKDICAEIDAMKENDDTIVTTVNGKLLTCNNIWEKLQDCPRVQTGDLDLDGLCSDLQKKAKCGGNGAVVDEQDFKAVMTKYLGHRPGDCYLTVAK